MSYDHHQSPTFLTNGMANMMAQSLWCHPGWFSANMNTMTHLIQGTKRVIGERGLHSLAHECLNPNFDPGKNPASKATTFSSDVVNRRMYLEEQMNGGTLRISNPRYRREIPFANDIAICHWFINSEGHGKSWARIDYDHVRKAFTPEFQETLTATNRPIDGLKTFGSTMLHEVSSFSLVTGTQLRNATADIGNHSSATQTRGFSDLTTKNDFETVRQPATAGHASRNFTTRGTQVSEALIPPFIAMLIDENRHCCASGRCTQGMAVGFLRRQRR